MRLGDESGYHIAENTELEAPFTLTPAERISPVWQKLSRHLEDELQRLRIKNDSTKLSESETAALRGQIQSLKTIIGLGVDPEPLV